MDETLLTTEIDLLANTIIEREMTLDEIDNYNTLVDEASTRVKQLKTQLNNRKSALAKLAALGLTQEEIDAL